MPLAVHQTMPTWLSGGNGAGVEVHPATTSNAHQRIPTGNIMFIRCPPPPRKSLLRSG